MLPMKRLLLFALPVFLFAVACKEEAPAPPEEEAPLIEQTFPITYNAFPPEGKLPYPHHNPTISVDELQQLTNELFIINNYGQYQCGDVPDECYFHSGLDFIIPNGTPIFAIEDGIVRANRGGNEYYRSLAVEDMDEQGKAWFYTHVYDFVVVPGDTVEQGQFLGVVNFQGLEHIHLSRGYLKENGSWDRFGDWVYTFPDDFFVLPDETAPIIETPFLFFKNRSNERFEQGRVDTVSGEVDIVVGMRDAGKYTGAFLGQGNYWGDRLCVKRVDFRILREGEEILSQHSFDLEKLELTTDQDSWRRSLIMFKHHTVFEPDPEPAFWNRFVSHYILTNSNPDSPNRIYSTDDKFSWDTTERIGHDAERYPNGLYVIEVTAYDTNENSTSKSDSVYVKN